MFTLVRARLSRILAAALLLGVALGQAAPLARAQRSPYFLNHLDERLLRAAQQVKASAAATAAGPRQARSANLTLVSSVPLPGFNADVWGHKGFAYVGSWGIDTNGFCPATGVRIIDLSDPSHPTLIGAVAALPGTSQEDMVVRRIRTPFFRGDLLVTGVQFCLDFSSGEPVPAGVGGVDIWDVTDPYHPRHLAFWPNGSELGTRGVHELDLFQRGTRAFITAAVPFSEFDPVNPQGDFRLVEVTDPRHPVQVSDWGLGDIGAGPFCGPEACAFDHSAIANQDGTMAILSYWDFGAVFLDISDPAHPAFVGRTVYPAGSDGDTHSVALARGENLLLTADEDFSPIEVPDPPADDTWGFLRLWDVKNPANPVEIGRFGTPNSLSTRTDGFYSIHNPLVLGNIAFLSWYTDGLRIVDISKPGAPREIASFVPPAVEDPLGFFPPVPLVWGVALDRSLILLSDINAGLYVLKGER
jgi:hypothetical protein